MRRFRKVGILWFLFLIFYCSAFLTFVLFMSQLGVSTALYLDDGLFLFSWEKALPIALKKGCIAGVLLGAGVWLKNKLYERKSKKIHRE